MTDAQTGEPLDQLIPSALTHVVQLGSQCDRASQIVRPKDEVVYRTIQRGIDLANSCAYNVQACAPLAIHVHKKIIFLCVIYKGVVDHKEKRVCNYNVPIKSKCAMNCYYNNVV